MRSARLERVDLFALGNGSHAAAVDAGRLGRQSFVLAPRSKLFDVSVDFDAVALAVLLADPAAPNGAVFVGVVAAYVLLRQLLFPLRALPRKTSWGRWLALGLAAVALIGSIAAIVIG